MEVTSAAKQRLRTEMRRARRAVEDLDARSATIWSVVQHLDAVAAASTVMAYRSIPGEPDTAPFVAWCRGRGVTVVVPEDVLGAATIATIDVVIVPGLAFTADGHRLGQGGGWYDRFLPTVAPECVTIGVGFSVQLVDHVPVEPHDIVLDHVVIDARLVR